MVVIIGDPSEEKMEKSGEEEKARVKRQREELGEEGLAKKKKIVDDAIAENSVRFTILFRKVYSTIRGERFLSPFLFSFTK